MLPTAMFLNPGFLLALAAAAIPLWLHLSRRRKYRELQVGTLRFLQAALRERKRKSRLEEIPLLLLRMAAAALLAFGFARPFFVRAETVTETERNLIILLDASGSVTDEMATTARKAAARAIADAETGKVTLAQFSDEVQLLDSLQQYQPAAGSPTNMTAALGWALDQLVTGGRSAGKVVVISHLPTDALPNEPPRVWPPQVTLELVPLEPPSVDNAAVLGVSLLTPYVDEEMEIEALVSLPRGRTTDEARTVTLEAEGLRHTAVVAAGTERVVFRFRPPREEVRGWVSVKGDDAWPADDRRPFALRWRERARVILVDGQPGSTPYEGQAYFIDKALASSGAAHGLSQFQPEIIFALDGRSGPVSLEGVRVIALCGVTDLPPATARALGDYVAKGGGLISVLNDKWTPGAGAPLVSEGLLPDAIAFAEGEEKRVMTAWDRAHPALAMFDGRDGGDLRELSWRDGFHAKASPGWRVLASLDSGNAILLEKEQTNPQAGRVLVCAHPLTREWTDLPREPLFVPLVKNLFAACGNIETVASEGKVTAPGIREQRPIGHHIVGEIVEVVAPDQRESRVAPAGEAAFRAAFGIPDPAALAVISQPPTQAEERSRPGEIWPWVLLALLFILATENFLATRVQPVAVSTP